MGRKKKTFRRKRLTLRQILLIGVAFVALTSSIATYVLAVLDKISTAENLALAFIGLFGTAFAAYLTADTLDHNSKNKYGAQNHDDYGG